jgi:hypothetical protein
LRTKRNLILAAATAALLVVAPVPWLTRGPSPEELLAVKPEGELVSFVDNLSASSTAPPITDADDFEIDFDVDNLNDDSRDSAWRTECDGVGERINLVFDEPIRVTSIGLLPGWALFEDGVDFSSPIAGSSRSSTSSRMARPSRGRSRKGLSSSTCAPT